MPNQLNNKNFGIYIYIYMDMGSNYPRSSSPKYVVRNTYTKDPEREPNLENYLISITIKSAGVASIQLRAPSKA